MKTCRASLLLLAVSTICAATASAATLYWKGPGNANAVANWCTDAELTVAATAVPVDGDDIILGTGAGDMTWNLNDVTPGSWTQTADYAGTVTFNTGRRNGIPTSTALKVGGTTVYLCGVTEDGGLTRTFKVSGNCSLLGGVWTHSAQPTKTSNFTSYAASSSGLGVFRILADIGGNLDIGAAFSMDVTGKGFDLNARGPGGNGGNNDSANHAGVGGKNANKATKNCYGRFRMPNTIGSAGGSTGGGAIEITVAGALTMASGATLKANGTNVSYYAGAGGSISIVAGSISGAGSLAANGGATTSDSGGGGGGGRISIVLTGAGQDFTGFSGTYSTVESHQFGKTTGNDGFGGTTYLETAADGVGGGILMVDGSKQFHSRGRLRNYGTPITADECAYNLKKIVLRDGARLVIPQNVTYSVPPIEAATPNNAETNYIAVYNNTLVFADVNRTISGPCGITTYNSDSSVVNVIKMGASGTGTLTLASEGSLQIDSQTTLMGSLVVANGGIATHSTGGTSATYMLNLTVTGNVTVNSGGAISATGKGYTTAVGKGSSGNSKNAGGMHAGRINDNGQHKTKHCYGSIRRPVAYGSGGSGTVTDEYGRR